MTEERKVTYGQVLDALGKSLNVDPKKIVDEVNANLARLRSCAIPHNFVPADDKLMPHYHRCTKCNGTVTTPHAHWYKEGLAHGGKVL